METSWINVADTAVKIGLGAAIATASGYLSLIKNQKHEIDKLKRDQFYKLQEEKKHKYVEFLSLSTEIMQSHLYKSSEPESEQILNYHRIFNEVQILSNDSIRIAIFKVYSSIEAFAYLNKHSESELMVPMRDNAKKQIADAQKILQLETNKEYI